MISLNKIFLAIFTFIIFLWLIFTTFLNKNYNSFEEVYYKDNEKGIYSLEFKEDQVFFNSGSIDGKLKINYINSFDKIIEYKGNSIINNGEINIEKGIYLFNISELDNSYNINGEGFNIKTNGPQTIFIDNSGVRTNIFSLNSKVELNLINIENNKIINTLYLYPHKYIRFIPNQNKNVENADLLKLTQRFPLDYFGESILIDGKINENLIKKVIGNKTEEENQEIKNMFLFLYLNNKYENNLLKNFESKKFGTLLGEKLIIKYNKLFLNESKQIIYYKNLIIRTIGDLINSKGENNSKSDFLIKLFDELKNLSEVDYNEMKNIFYFYSNLVIDGEKEEIEPKINFSKIKNVLENNNNNFNDEYLLKLNNIYFKYDFNNDSSFYNNLANINKEIIDKELTETQKSYLIFFMNKIILYGFDQLNENNDLKLDDILNIFNYYTNISITYYDKEDSIRIRTGIEEYNQMLKKLKGKINEVYFEKERDNKGLLVLNKSNNLSKEKLIIFENNIKTIFNYFYKNNKYLLDRSKDELIKKEFSESKKIFDEYILAIKNYDSYIANYSEENKKLLFGETVNKNNDIESDKYKVISVENALDFLNQFNYIETTYSKISLRGYNYCNNPIEKNDIDEYNEPYCYKIEKIIIGSNVELDMILVPNEGNNIFNFSINGDKNINKGSYKLNNEKIVWDENLENNGSEENSEKYKFENFFLYVFNPPIENNTTNNNTTNNNTTNNNTTNDESLIIKIFKRNKLLGENGDFKNIEGFIDIKYEDLIVKEDGNDYDIQINNAKFKYAVKGGIEYSGYFNSKYNFIPNHSFIQSEITVYNDTGTKLLYGNMVKIVGDLNVESIKDDLYILFDNLNYLQLILDIIRDNSITIYYDMSIDKFIIKNNNLEITTLGNYVDSIIYNGKELLKSGINIYELENILKLTK
ncbi:MAG: hypothetical protein PHI37_01635 [Candidatus Gracilibacteria bacterium]|nr:hypothetical protein [Candidatus Gracilibacteria bacterium]